MLINRSLHVSHNILYEHAKIFHSIEDFRCCKLLFNNSCCQIQECQYVIDVARILQHLVTSNA